MVLRLYNTFTEKKEVFTPLFEDRVKMFVCGPTVYENIHLGHARTFLFYETLARFLEEQGYSVDFLMNITDIDDKVFEKAKATKQPHQDVSSRYTESFVEDLNALGVRKISRLAKASDHLAESLKQISDLIVRGYAYRAGRNVYFDTSRFPSYGRLSHQEPWELQLRRLDSAPEKRLQTDFLLWRGTDEAPCWTSPFGNGRPGWHIEDTAITIPHFGPQYDIHGGASELIFPHHEAEIAQAEALTGVSPFVRFWVHTGILKINGEKMSKSAGNFITVKEALKMFELDALKICFFSSKYRADFDLTPQKHDEADKKARILISAWDILEDSGYASRTASDPGFIRRFELLTRLFTKYLSDDLDTAHAMDTLIRAARLLVRRPRLGPNDSERVKSCFAKMLQILGLLTERRARLRVTVPCLQ
jgi:cysteinyl-tRNA synthetase